jgi:hypothetical protein
LFSSGSTVGSAFAASMVFNEDGVFEVGAAGDAFVVSGFYSFPSLPSLPGKLNSGL